MISLYVGPKARVPLRKTDKHSANERLLTKYFYQNHQKAKQMIQLRRKGLSYHTIAKEVKLSSRISLEVSSTRKNEPGVACGSGRGRTDLRRPYTTPRLR